MSLWGLRFHHTAKMPEPVRQRAERKGYKQLDFLVTLRNQAIIFASSEDILIYASFVHLPQPTADEAETLRESSSDEATTEDESDQEQEVSNEDPWNSQAASSAAAVDEADAVDSQGDTESEEHAGDGTLPEAEAASLPPPAAQASNNDTTTAESSVTANKFLTNDPGSSEGSNGQSSGESMDVDSPSPTDTGDTNTNGTNPEGNSSQWLTNTPGSPYENQVATSPKSANSPSQSDEGYGTAAHEDGGIEADSVGEGEDVPAQHNIRVPIYMRPSTLFDTTPTWADQYRKFFDKAFMAWKVFYINRAPRPLRARLQDRRTHEAAVKRYNLINLGFYPLVTAGHLLELHRRIADVAHFCDCVSDNIREIDLAKNLRKEVIYTYPANSPLRLRSKGLGSSLRYVAHVDEGWADPEDNWGMPPPSKKRSLIQSHAPMSW
ncbi:hypothetical protein FMUND_4319 [Fusarium mundagurra]|uniref:Uncharacterized protein n=1 Tax=Fusarium mundagurra TaxID=1567541 RepID=A0A8H5YW97_9HYPO|nr:hypothetical protein FMUND_4319 [Fusarium mundagurra]